MSHLVKATKQDLKPDTLVWYEGTTYKVVRVFSSTNLVLMVIPGRRLFSHYWNVNISNWDWTTNIGKIGDSNLRVWIR
jgi:hypothetical protein